MRKEDPIWIVSKSGKHTCSECGFTTYDYSRICPSCNASMAITVKRLRKWRCGCCHELFESWAWRYDYSPSGDDVAFCPLCGCEDPDVEEVWEEDE